MTDNTPTQSFEVFRALHRGGLSLWLNRKTLLPMTLVPTVTTFLTLMLIRGAMPQDSSAFLLSLVQIPADFITGIFCALIIFIIVSAPRKKDSDKPVMFKLNLNEQKKVFFAAALAHVIFGYFAGGLFGVMTLIYEPINQAAQSDVPPSMISMVLLGFLLFVMLYGIRFLFLPILIVAQVPIRDFFARHMTIGMSFPIFIVKLAATMSLGFFVLVLSSPFMAGTEGGIADLPTTDMAIVDFITAFANIIATAWAYAALTVGYRQMTEGLQK